VESDTKFIYDGWNLIAELDVTASLNVTATYAWGLDWSGTGQGAGGVGGLLQITRGSATYATAYDGNGNLMALISRSTGSLAAEYEYDAFGQLLRASGDMAGINPFRFSTKYTDDETGFVYYGMRYYSPSQGRFITKDPSGENGGLNLYSMVSNSAVNSFDYLGLNKFQPDPFYYGRTHDDDESIPEGLYDVGNGKYACPFGYAWDGDEYCVKDPSAPTGPDDKIAWKNRYGDTNRPLYPTWPGPVGGGFTVFPGGSGPNGGSNGDDGEEERRRKEEEARKHKRDCEALNEKIHSLNKEFSDWSLRVSSLEAYRNGLAESFATQAESFISTQMKVRDSLFGAGASMVKPNIVQFGMVMYNFYQLRRESSKLVKNADFTRHSVADYLGQAARVMLTQGTDSIGVAGMARPALRSVAGRAGLLGGLGTLAIDEYEHVVPWWRERAYHSEAMRDSAGQIANAQRERNQVFEVLKLHNEHFIRSNCSQFF
jgi:RHS repeat-associated protein